jgi:hypothetical protein
MYREARLELDDECGGRVSARSLLQDRNLVLDRCLDKAGDRRQAHPVQLGNLANARANGPSRERGLAGGIVDITRPKVSLLQHRAVSLGLAGEELKAKIWNWIAHRQQMRTKLFRSR